MHFLEIGQFFIRKSSPNSCEKVSQDFFTISYEKVTGPNSPSHESWDWEWGFFHSCDFFHMNFVKPSGEKTHCTILWLFSYEFLTEFHMKKYTIIWKSFFMRNFFNPSGEKTHVTILWNFFTWIWATFSYEKLTNFMKMHFLQSEDRVVMLFSFL